MPILRMMGTTGNDDLRDDCHAILRVFLKGKKSPLVFNPIFGGQGSNTSFDVSRDLGNVPITDIMSFQIERVSVEHGFESTDNWDMNSVEFRVVPGFQLVVARHGFHRFTGDSATLDIPMGRDPSWVGWEALGGPISSAPSVSSWGPDRLDIFAAGPEGNLIYTGRNNGDPDVWEWLGGVFHDNPAAVSWGPNRLDVFVRGLDNQLGHLAR